MTTSGGKRERTPERALMPGAAFPYERILLTFAALPQVEEVFQLALHLAAGPGRELFLLRVVPWRQAGGDLRRKGRYDEQSLYSEMRAINTLLHTEGIPARLEVAPAPGAEAIVAYAQEREVDLIIAVGRATDGGQYRRLIEEVLRVAPCTAMMLSATSPAAEGEGQRTAGGGGAAVSVAA